jgi:hypothetical protein
MGMAEKELKDWRDGRRLRIEKMAFGRGRAEKIAYSGRAGNSWRWCVGAR